MTKSNANTVILKTFSAAALLAGVAMTGLSALAAPSVSPVAAIQSLQLRGDAKTIAVMASGMSLYSFDPDQGSPAPVCNATCAEKWPPVIVESDADIAANPRFGSVLRASGLQQLTIDNKPVYTFFMDRHLGETKGDGAGKVWHLIEM